MCWPDDFYRFTSIAVLLSLGIACVNGRMVVLDAMAEGFGRVSYVSLSVPPTFAELDALARWFAEGWFA